MTTLITKYGNGIPTSSDLETGELGIDLTGKVIYTKDGGGNIIKLADGGASATVDWPDILNKPDFDSLYSAIDHTHEMSDIDGLEGKVTEIEENISDLEDELTALATSLAFGGSFSASSGLIVEGAKEGINDGAAIPAASTQPSTFLICVEGGDTPSTMVEGDWLVSNGTAWVPVTYASGSAGSVDWNNVENKPDFDNLYAAKDHTHEIADVDGLQDALDALPQSDHTHVFDDIVNDDDGGTYANKTLKEALDGKASIDRITGGTY